MKLKTTAEERAYHAGEAPETFGGMAAQDIESILAERETLLGVLLEAGLKLADGQTQEREQWRREAYVLNERIRAILADNQPENNHE